jgi:chromosome segregation ATPase
MIKETIVIDAETGKAESSVDKLAKAIEKLTDSVDDLGKESKESIDNIEESAKNTEKGVKGIGKAFKGLGTAIKAAGIGLVIGALATLKEVFTQNQKVADLFNTAFEATSLAFNDFVNFIVDNTQTVTEFFKDIFDNPLESVKSLGDAIQQNLIERFNSALEVFGFVSEALSKLLEGDFKGALSSIKEAGTELVDVFTGVDGTTEKVAEGLAKVASAAADYGKKIVENAKENVKLQNEAEIATAQQSRLVEQYDRQAEKLRQIRDNDLLTLEERTAANDELLEVLNAQEEAMLKQADAQVKAAQAAVDKNNSIENQIALTEALTNQEGVLAQVEGFRSEQDSNRTALKKEQLELTNSQTQAEGERTIAELEANAELIENEYYKLEALRDVAEQEKQIQTDLLTAKRDSYKEGTQAFQDANNELLAFQKENAQKQKQIDRDLTDAKMAETSKALGTIASIVGENSKFGKGIAVVQAIQDTYAGATKAFAQGGIFGYVGAAGIIASGLANVKKITSTKEPQAPSFAKSGGSAPSISVPAPTIQAPSFNIVGSSETNQLAEAIGSQSQQPIKAYVVSNDVTTAQSLDRNIVESASL